MDGDIDLEDKVIPMRGKFSIKEMLGQPGDAKAEPEPKGESPPQANGEAAREPAADPLPPMERLPPLPGPGDPYKAYARPANQMLPTLVLLLADASVKAFSYNNLDTLDLLPAKDAGDGPVMVLRFSGIVATEIVLTGRDLDELYNYLGFHRVAWIRERSPSRHFLSEMETVITGIRIKKLEG